MVKSVDFKHLLSYEIFFVPTYMNFTKKKYVIEQYANLENKTNNREKSFPNMTNKSMQMQEQKCF